ncbi:hypothetical protein [Streptomyces sp. DSM 40750]|uniref:hypothetical protein n=1 Tax=Streptomyces sp. DSM 40750 TaxID=2801030 RepID=UPI00214B950C|nr:hypothetical protein [Streptomyces sp. DSM 40750]UUU22863.1 hypothetical protein JIX55_22635 [Streptomyces sp. DSM 40750]
MLRTLKAAGVATAAALALTGIAAAPAQASAAPAQAPTSAQAQALYTDGYLDCDLYSVIAWGSGYTPGQTIIVRHLGDWLEVPQDTLVVEADGTWETDYKPFSGWEYTVEVRDTQGNVLDSEWIHQCGIW